MLVRARDPPTPDQALLSAEVSESLSLSPSLSPPAHLPPSGAPLEEAEEPTWPVLVPRLVPLALLTVSGPQKTTR